MKADGKLIGALLGLVLTRRPQGVLLGLLVGWIFDLLRQQQRQRQADATACGELHLSPGASQAEIESAWRRLIAQHHPDRLAGLSPAQRDLASARAAAINAAYRTLRPRRRPGTA
jgi:preprotein translocase subunit Sec63